MKVDYLMTRDYCADWSVEAAIREFAQNALDAGGNPEFEINAEELVISTESDIDLQYFALGNSTKKAEDLGQFGEGFKIALMVLTAKGVYYTFSTSGYLIKGAFEYNEQLGVETFCLTFVPNNSKGTELYINEPDVDAVCKMIPHFTGQVPKYGHSLNNPGNIYVGGLFVMYDAGLHYSYNFKPAQVRMNRDRQGIADIRYKIGQYWAEQSHLALLFNLLINDVPDVQNAWLYLTKEYGKQLKQKYLLKFGHIPVQQSGYSSAGFSGVSLSQGSYKAFAQSGVSVKKEVDPHAPIEVIKAFLAKHKIEDNELIRKAKGWRND